VLILERTTAALDPRSEYAVSSDLPSYGAKLLFLFRKDSHRRMADRIVVLENGELPRMAIMRTG